MRFGNALYLSVLSGIILCIMSMKLFTPDHDFSDIENRYLMNFPKLSWDSVRSGDFDEKVEQYLGDHFPFRERWVTIKAMTDLTLQKKENNDVYLGKDHFLLQKITEPSTPLTDHLEYIRQFAEAVDGRIFFMLAPNSAAILTDKLPTFAPVPKQNKYIREAYEYLDKHVMTVDAFTPLQLHKDEPIYYRTDHHWTTLGTYYAYQAFAKEAGILSLDKEDFYIERVSNQFYGTLYAKSSFRHIPPDAIDLWIPNNSFKSTVTHLDDQTTLDSLYDWSQLKKRDQYPLFLGGNHALSIIKTEEAPKRTLLVIKDSYAHSFAPFLAQHYDEIHLLDLRYANMSVKDYAKQIGADDILILYNVASFQEDKNVVKFTW